MVGFDPGYNFSFTGYTIYEYDFYTGYNGSILFRAYAMSGTLEHIAAQGDLARVVNFSANSLSTGHRMFHPVQIDSDSTLSVRYGLDRQIPGSVVPTYNKQSILSVTVGTVSTDVASLPIYDEPFIRQSNVIAIGQGIAIVAMPKLWPIAVQPDIGYNVGFTFNNPYSYWGNEYPIDGFTIFDRYQDVFVASRYGAVPLLSGVDYNRTITVIPTGGGTALIFCVRRAVFSAPMQPEVYFFDGYEVAKFPNSDLWPDVYGYCVADGIAVFCTGQTDTAAPPAWCIFRSDLLTIRGLGLDPYISPTVGVSSARTWAHIEKVGSFTGRTYKIGDGSLYKSVVMMFFPDEHVEEADISVDGVWQLVASSVPVSNGALLIAYALEHEVPTYYHFFYLGIAKTDGDGRIVVNYVGRVTNTSGGFQLPTALRVSKGAVALQMDYAYDVEAVGFRPMPLETFYVSSGSEGKPIVSKGKHPKNWVGDLAQVGDSFVMFPPSEIVDLRPPVLASRGEL